MENPTVFISYSHDSDEHKAWVLKLATDLRSHGVNAILDQWDLRLGADLRFFMENGLSSSAQVLCVCSESYVQKVNAGSGGSGYEGMIMSQSLLQNANIDYIIPIVRNNESPQKVPVAFGSKLYIDFSDDEQYVAKYKEVLERIYGIDEKRKPPLGSNPFLTNISQQIDAKTKIEKVKYHSPEYDGTVVFDFDNNDRKYLIGTGEYCFETRWSCCANDMIYAYGYVGYIAGFDHFPTPDEFLSFNFSSWSRTIRTGEVFLLRNQYEHFAAVKLGWVHCVDRGYEKNKMTFDYHIYII